MTRVRVRRYTASDEAWAEDLLARRMGGRWQARRGELIDLLSLAGFVAEDDAERRVGIVCYQRHGNECELAGIVAEYRQGGVGTALVEALVVEAADCVRIWLVTTNDNLDALRFYQRRGFVLAALRPGGVDASRRDLKPGISLVGEYGIPLRDELELGLLLPRR